MKEKFAARVDIENSVESAPARNSLNVRRKLRQKSIVEAINGIDWTSGSEFPLVVELDPTTACNLACPDCISRDLLNQGYFSRDRLRSLTMEMVEGGVKAVVLIGGGEPLAHPEIGWVIEYLGENGVEIGITTNGLLINRYIEPISKYASWVRVSMDAGTTETYNFFRPSPSGKSMFDQAISNMKQLVRVKTGTLGYSFLILTEGEFDKAAESHVNVSGIARSNVADIYKAAVLAKEIGCDYFEIKPEYDINHYSVVQEKKLMDEARAQIEKCKGLEDGNFSVLEATKLQNVLRGEENIEEKHYQRCAVSQLRTLVTPSGVYVCPYYRGNEFAKIGDVGKQSFKEMWDGEEREGIMQKLDPSIHCKMHCIRHDSNLALEAQIDNPQDHSEIIDDYDLFI
jgi:MoaA/NifB/PqqE/SkfB family radical SAM enzyme